MNTRAKELRKNMTNAELKLWYALRDRRLAGFKFRRQHAIGSYVVDFYCAEKNLIVELDGGQHTEQEQYDQERSHYLEKQGYRVIRFWNTDVVKNIEGVLEVIRGNLGTPHPAPSPLGGEKGIKVSRERVKDHNEYL